MPPANLHLRNKGEPSLESLTEETRASLFNIAKTNYQKEGSTNAHRARSLFNALDVPATADLLLYLARERSVETAPSTTLTEEESALKKENESREIEVGHLLRWCFADKFIQLITRYKEYKENPLEAFHLYSELQKANLSAICQLSSLQEDPRINKLFAWWQQNQHQVIPSLIAHMKTVRHFADNLLQLTQSKYKENPLEAFHLYLEFKKVNLSAIRQQLSSLQEDPSINELFAWWQQNQQQVIPSLISHIKTVLTPLLREKFKTRYSKAKFVYDQIDRFNYPPINTFLLSCLADRDLQPLFEWWIKEEHERQKATETEHLNALNPHPSSPEEVRAIEFTFGATLPKVFELKKTLLLRTGQHALCMQKIDSSFKGALYQIKQITDIMRQLSFREDLIHETHKKMTAIFSAIHTGEQDISLDIDPATIVQSIIADIQYKIEYDHATLNAARLRQETKLRETLNKLEQQLTENSGGSAEEIASNKERIVNIKRQQAALLAKYKLMSATYNESKKRTAQLAARLSPKLQALTQESNLLCKCLTRYKKWSNLRLRLLQNTRQTLENNEPNHVFYLIKEPGSIQDFLCHSHFRDWVSKAASTLLGEKPRHIQTSSELITLTIANARANADRVLFGARKSLANVIKMHPGYPLLQHLVFSENLSGVDLIEAKRMFNELLSETMINQITRELKVKPLTAEEKATLVELKTLVEKIHETKLVQIHTFEAHHANDDETFLFNKILDNHEAMRNQIADEVSQSVTEDKTQPRTLSDFLKNLISKVFSAFYQVNTKEITITLNKKCPLLDTATAGSTLATVDSLSQNSSMQEPYHLDDTASDTSSTEEKHGVKDDSSDFEESSSNASSSSSSYKTTLTASTLRHDDSTAETSTTDEPESVKDEASDSDESSTKIPSSASSSYKATGITSIIRRDEPNFENIFSYEQKENSYAKRFPLAITIDHYLNALSLAFAFEKLGDQESARACLFHALLQLETAEKICLHQTLEQAQRELFLTRGQSLHSFFRSKVAAVHGPLETTTEDTRALLTQAKSHLLFHMDKELGISFNDPDIELRPTRIRAHDRAISLTSMR